VASRRFPIGWWPWDKSLGDVLYAVAVYLVLALIRPAARPKRMAVIALLICEVIEAFQATGIPARLQHLPGARWLLGTEFAWHDVACYVIGIGIILALDLLAIRRREL
jgi:hypothetical protein